MDEELYNQETKQIAKEIATLNNEPSIDIKISELAAWCLIVQLQAAARHPANTGITAKQSRDIADEIHSSLKLPPVLEQVTRRGWLLQYDAKPNESAQEYASRVPQREIIEVHNAYSFYCSNPDSDGLITFSRPQDWGNKNLWAYEQFTLEWLVNKYQQHIINHVHCWYNPKEIPFGDVPIAFSRCIAIIAMPGKPKQLCSNQYLEPEDIWSDEWGKMPPVYEPFNDDYYKDDY